MNDIQAVGANRSGRAQDNDPAVVHSLEGKKAGRQAAPKGPVRRSTEQRRSFPDGRSGPTIPVGQNRRIVVGLHGISQVVLAWGVGHGRPEARLLQEAGLLPTLHASRPWATRSPASPRSRASPHAPRFTLQWATRSPASPRSRASPHAPRFTLQWATRSPASPRSRASPRPPRPTLHASRLGGLLQ